MPASKAVTVYCASSVGKHPAYIRAAQSVGKALAEAKRTLVYGGGSKGIMGEVSGAVLESGGDVTGIVPYAMVAAGGEVDQTQGKRGPSVLLEEKGRERVNTVIVNTMHERKTEMAKRSGSFIALPGGYGTFEELFEVICWSQLGIHEKPIVVINALGFYSPLRDLIRNGVEAEFITPTNANLVRFVDGPPDHAEHEDFDWGKAALDVLDNWTFPERTHFYDWSRMKTVDGEKIGDALDAV
ncbi:hypothetical protein DAEQUDRAFT_764927 [Daedalea quercina L-15889]|uniref:Lysine decarboxylase n=1 Tax=Daedalea quercina L-15889 TaxID=1314783 RepID=A0A165R1T0_9APHY|nr:hypothetical protein DAEQUDRAFT_764927 [Daedalea quercina L-15889]